MRLNLMKRLKSVILEFANALFRLLPIRKNRVLFQTFQGTYWCNPRYVTEVLARKPEVELIWALDGDAPTDALPPASHNASDACLRHSC